MFCPNCGENNKIEQSFCRSCGLKLDAVLRAISEQIPTKDYAKLQKRKDWFEKLGIFSSSVSAVIAIGLFLSKVIYYKLILFGADVLYWSGFTALIIFGLLSVFFFNYPKLFMNLEKANKHMLNEKEPAVSDSANATNKLLPDGVMEPIPTITEKTTGLLSAKRKINSGNL